MEELFAFMPMTIVDPAGEYWTLRERYEVLIAGRFRFNDAGARVDHCDLEITVEDAETVAEYSFRNKVSVVLDLLLFDEDERATLLATYFKRLWDLVVRQPQPYAVVCDEAHNFIPQNGKTAVKRHLIRLAKEGRKFGISFIFATQRPASITKDVITQALMLLLHGVYYATDIATYTTIIPRLKPAESETLIDQLKTGQAIFVQGKASQVITMRRRLTTHAGSTPELAGVTSAALRAVDEKTVDDLKALLIPAATGVDDGNPKEAARRDVITQLQCDLATKEKEIVELRTQVEHWKALVQGRSISDALPDNVVQLRMDGESLPDELAERATKRASAAQIRAIKRQMDALKRFKGRIGGLPPYEREVLLWMSLRQGEWVTRETILQTLSISRLSMRQLVDLGLVERDKRSKTHRFRFKEGMLKQMFPDLDADYVLDQISPIKERVV